MSRPDDDLDQYTAALDPEEARKAMEAECRALKVLLETPVAHQVSLLERTLAAEAERDRWRALAECEAGIKAPEGWEWFPYDEEEAAMWLSGDSYVYRDANGVFHGVFLHRRTPEISGPYRYYLEAIEAANQAAEQDALADSAATGMVAEARQGEE